MDQSTSFHQPRISRETRRLLIAALLALLALWMLARVRFSGDSPPQTVVQPLLGQITARPTFSDLATEISRVQSRLRPALLVVETAGSTGNHDASPPAAVTALRVSDTLAIALLPYRVGDERLDVERVATDAASGLTVLTAERADDVLPLTTWTPMRPQDPRYLLATTTYSGGVSLRPVFVPALSAVTRPAWPGQLWKAASGSDLEPGSFVFTTGGDFAGLVVDDAGERTIVGGDVLQAEIDRLRDRGPRAPGQLGVAVQPLSPAVAAVTGATGGVVVTWVDPQGAAAGVIAAGDVIEEADGERLTAEAWAVRAARVAPGETVTVGLRRGGAMREVALVAGTAEQSSVPALGLTMRALPGVGSEVLRVTPFAAAQRAGIEPGDVITLAGGTPAPTPGHVRTAYASTRDGGAVLLALARGLTHRVVVLRQ
ncbi:MAG TPA: PDZ domain-containing protein [Vicinamibacterales bacterium]